MSDTRFRYAPDGQRYLQSVRDNLNFTKYTLYPFDGYEVEAQTPSNLPAPATYRRTRQQMGGYGLRQTELGHLPRSVWLHTDRLGSTVAKTNQNGQLVRRGDYPYATTPTHEDRHGFDAFGKPRTGDWRDVVPNIQAGTPGASGLLGSAVTPRGFTGHEHLDQFALVGLIHMNGRVYDPRLGRFLSVDPIIQFPANSQSLNPYSYILNNPMSGTDPTGYTGIMECTGSRIGSIGSGSLCGGSGQSLPAGINGVADFTSGGGRNRSNGAHGVMASGAPSNGQRTEKSDGRERESNTPQNQSIGQLNTPTDNHYKNATLTHADSSGLMQEQRASPKFSDWTIRFRNAGKYLKNARRELGAKQFESPDAADRAFGDMFAEVSGEDWFWLEFGANIVPVNTEDGTKYVLRDLRMSRTIDSRGMGSSVSIPFHAHAIAWTHTHPEVRLNENGHAFSWADVENFVTLRRDAYVHLPNRESFRLNSSEYFKANSPPARYVYYNQDRFVRYWHVD